MTDLSDLTRRALEQGKPVSDVLAERVQELEAENATLREFNQQLEQVHKYAVAYVFLRENASHTYRDGGYADLKNALAEHGLWFRGKVQEANQTRE